MKDAVVVRAMQRPDLDDVVRVHLCAFPGFFLAQLGPRFLWLYYRGILEQGQIGLVALSGDALAGFVTGIESQSGFYRRLLRRRGLAMALAALPTALRRPRVIPRLARALAKRPAGSKADTGRATTLTSLAVSPALHGGGLGHALMRAYVEEARRRKLTRVVLETDVNDNAPVVRFYEREGFAIVRSYCTPEGRRMHELALDL